MKKSNIISFFTASAFLLMSAGSFAQHSGGVKARGSSDRHFGGYQPGPRNSSSGFSQSPRNNSNVYNGPYKPRVTQQRPPVSNFGTTRVRSNYSPNRYYSNNYNRGNRFYYNGGYHPRPVYYRPFPRPSFGVRINVLPSGYYPVHYGRRNYYYYNGIFYQPYGGYYQTIAPPLGAVITVLPPGAYFSTINNIGYYEYQGTYYEPYTGGYRVAGVDGYLKPDLEAANSDDGDIISDESIAMSSAPEGFTTLPADYKTVTLNGTTYYVSPTGEYYTKNIDENGKISYRLSAAENQKK